MKNLFFILIILLLSNCSGKETVYWCGDHKCINKKEREAYFKKTMIVEIRDLNKKDKKNKIESEIIRKQAIKNEKKRLTDEKSLAKQAKLEKKQRRADEKRLAKQAKLEEKQRRADEKRLAKQARLEEKNVSKRKKLKKVDKSVNKTIPNEAKIKRTDLSLNEFNDVVNKIIEKNVNKPYPEINNITR